MQLWVRFAGTARPLTIEMHSTIAYGDTSANSKSAQTAANSKLVAQGLISGNVHYVHINLPLGKIILDFCIIILNMIIDNSVMLKASKLRIHNPDNVTNEELKQPAA